MAISEESRHRLYGRLEAVLGPEEAATMMAHLPPVGWADVATRRDLDHFESGLRAEMAVLRAELRGEMAALSSELGGEMATLSSDLRREMGDVRTEMADLRTEMADLRTEMADLRTDVRGQTRSLFLSLAGLQMTAAALAIAVSRLL